MSVGTSLCDRLLSFYDRQGHRKYPHDEEEIIYISLHIHISFSKLKQLDSSIQLDLYLQYNNYEKSRILKNAVKNLL